MWQVRRKYWLAMPRDRKRSRFIVGPSSIRSCFTTSSSRFRLKLCSAFAAADLITFATSIAACLGENSRYASASPTFSPLTESATSRALRGVRFTYFATACTSISFLVSLLERRAALGVVAVAAEIAGGRELAQLVADHVLGDVDGHVLAAVVDGHRVPDQVREDGAGPRPGPDDLLLAGRVQLGDLLLQVVVDEGSLLG